MERISEPKQEFESCPQATLATCPTKSPVFPYILAAAARTEYLSQIIFAWVKRGVQGDLLLSEDTVLRGHAGKPLDGCSTLLWDILFIQAPFLPPCLPFGHPTTQC